jgi:TetR/AcrR family transcriptional regulator, transcriptional repressor for nem operon
MTMAAGGTDTATRILDSAERLVQSRGFNGFSYADVAAELGITKASLHYHFAGKAELGQALIERYCERFAHTLEQIDASGGPAAESLRAYAAIYTDVLRHERLCLCGMLAADYTTLPAAMRRVVVRFFDENERWVAAVLDHGRADGTLSFSGAAEDAARTLVGGLEGAMLVARPYGDVARFEAAADRLVASVAGVDGVPLEAAPDR